ncbi:MAG: flagellar biosynthetic protein FliR, partial [Chlamydiia bacterium]|nr:flagellar biosynthetic protein FliR [Chlamydiia bacterium]
MLENDYVNLYLNTGYGFSSPTGLITLFLLAMMRILPILSFAPYLGAKLLPRPVKVGLGLAMFAIFFPMLLTVSPSNLTYNSFTWVLVVKEVFIGTLMGILTTVPSFIVQGAGMFIDHQRGGASLQVQDPTMQNQASPIGTLYDLIYIFLFWLVDGPFILIETIHHSFEVVPPDKLLNPAFFTADSPFWLNVVELFNHIMKLIVQLASPSLIIILMTDTFLGI